MIKKITKRINRSTPTRYNRILNFIYVLKNNINITNKKDQDIVIEIENIAKQIIKKVQLYSRLNILFYFAIYFSFVSYVFSDVEFLSELTSLISQIIGIFGTTIFIIAIYFANKIIDLHYQDLNLITANLISIYSKYQKQPIEELAEDKSNYYSAFITFFNRRYD